MKEVFKSQREMDKFNEKTNPHGGPGIAGVKQGAEESLRSKPGPGWSEAREEMEGQGAVTSGGSDLAAHGEGLLAFMERTGRIEPAGL